MHVNLEKKNVSVINIIPRTFRKVSILCLQYSVIIDNRNKDKILHNLSLVI